MAASRSASLTSPFLREGSSSSGMLSAGAHEDHYDDEIDEPSANPRPVSANLLYSDWVASMADGRAPRVAIYELAPTTFEADKLVDFAFPNHILQNPEECLKRYILAPTDYDVKFYNDLILERAPGDERRCWAADSLKGVDENDGETYCTILDHVQIHAPPGLPDHTLKIKPNAVFRFIKDFSVDPVLPKNTRVIVTKVVSVHLITVRPIGGGRSSSGPDSGDIFIPRIDFTHRLPSGITVCRRQFPLAPAYATTFDDCLGPTLDRVAIDHARPAYSFNKIYTALSKIRNRTDGLVRLIPGDTL